MVMDKLDSVLRKVSQNVWPFLVVENVGVPDTENIGVINTFFGC